MVPSWKNVTGMGRPLTGDLADFTGPGEPDTTYDITDAVSGETLGSARRKGFKSMLRDSWELYGPHDELLATATNGARLAEAALNFQLGAAQSIPRSLAAMPPPPAADED